MEIPPLEDPVWSEILTGKISLDFDYFAAKLLQAALARTVGQDSEPEKLRKCSATLRELFVRNQNKPVVQRDLQKILAREKANRA